MTQLINAVLLVLHISRLALSRRVNHLEKVILTTTNTEEGKKGIVPGAEEISLHMENLDLQARSLEDAAGAQGAAAKTSMQEVQRGHSPSKEVDAHTVTQATGDAMTEFLRALQKHAKAIFAEAKAAARAGLYKSMDLGSGNAQESKKEADAAAATVIDAEKELFEKTELLAGEPFGKEILVSYMLEGYGRGEEKTVKLVLERFQTQFIQLEIDIVRVGLHPKDIVAVKTLQIGLSTLKGQVQTMQSQGLDGEEIDLTKPLLWESNAIYYGMVKVLPDFLKVQLNLLRKLVEKHANEQGKTVKVIKLPPKMRKKIALDKFLEAVDNMEQRKEMESIIQKEIEEFVEAKVSTLAGYMIAKNKLVQAVKATMDKLGTFDPEMKQRQKGKIDNAMKEKKHAMAIAPN